MWSPQVGLWMCLLPAAVVQASLNYVGCFSHPLGLVDIGPNMYQSRGLCAQRCTQIDQWVVGLTNGTNCLCGSRVPSTHYLVDDGDCNSPCAGYAMESSSRGLGEYV
ncbi:Wsc-domain-containing protein [Apiospora kogelbergensis]|uniref:Wsc-domain-containing protein n=1 Tax=Apiospora kogelbergensis TaxID=1337665 RepID=A0AAW0QA94_9PEZI